MTAIDEVRALTAEAVQRKKCSIRQLEVELTESDSAGSRLPRAVLDEVADGVRSAAEAWLREVIEASALPQPLWNADLLDAQERWLARPDALWPEASLIAEVESREWHLSPASWAATMKRTNVLSRLGYDVQQFPPSRIRREAAGVIAELTEAYELGLLRRDASQRPAVTIRPADAGAGPTLATAPPP